MRESGRVLKLGGTFVLISHSSAQQWAAVWEEGEGEEGKEWKWQLSRCTRIDLNNTATWANIIRHKLPKHTPLSHITKPQYQDVLVDSWKEYQQIVALRNLRSIMRAYIQKKRAKKGETETEETAGREEEEDADRAQQGTQQSYCWLTVLKKTHLQDTPCETQAC
eukprot:Platyproteum_vivax@DN5414_c0_g1_i1.p1